MFDEPARGPTAEELGAPPNDDDRAARMAKAAAYVMKRHVERCEEHLKRLRFVVDQGDYHPDHYHLPAISLAGATRRMAYETHDLARYERECSEQFEMEGPRETPKTAACTRPGGHDGDHANNLPPSAFAVAARRVRALADQVESLGHLLDSQSLGHDFEWPTGLIDDPEHLRDYASTVSYARHQVDHVIDEAHALNAILTTAHHDLARQARALEATPTPGL